MPTIINGSYLFLFVNSFFVFLPYTGRFARLWVQLLWWQKWSKSLVEEGRLKVQKFGVYVWDGPHFFQAFKRKIAVYQCLLAGIPLGETRSGNAAATCRPQSKHLYCALKCATSQCASWKHLSTLPRAVEKYNHLLCSLSGSHLSQWAKKPHAEKWTDPNLFKHSRSIHLSDPKSSTWSTSVTSVLAKRGTLFGLSEMVSYFLSTFILL